MAYYDKKIEKYCLTKEEMETLPKNEARSRMKNGIVTSTLIIFISIAIVCITGMTPLGGIPGFIIIAGTVAGYLMLTGLANIPLFIREYFRNNKRLEYDEKHKDDITGNNVK